MCGIVGVMAKKLATLSTNNLDIFKDALICDSIRGEDSTGVFSVLKDGNAQWVKLATQPYNLINTKEYKDWRQKAWVDGRVVVGHNRKATQGGVNNANAHPFVFNNTILIHNGGLDNWRSLLSWNQRDKHKIEVDSHAACILLARHEPEKILPQFKGAFTFVWYDVLNKTLNFIRNEERPLNFAETDESVYFASEPGMLKWLLDRRGLKHGIQTLKPGVLVTVSYGEKGIEWTSKDIPLPDDRVQLIRQVAEAYHRRTQPAEEAQPLTEAARARARLLTPPVADIPEKERFNIHYGGDVMVQPHQSPFQQIIFTVDDYRQSDPRSTAVWKMWGRALDSTRIKVEFLFRGNEREAETIAYSPHLIGLVKNISAGKENGEWVQTVWVDRVEPVEITASPNAQPITVDHWNYLVKNGFCNCNQDCSNFDPTELFIEHNGSDTRVICSWCKNWDDEQAANETTTNTAVQTGK